MTACNHPVYPTGPTQPGKPATSGRVIAIDFGLMGTKNLPATAMQEYRLTRGAK